MQRQEKPKRQFGALHLTIHKAKGLQDVRLLGAQDPYCSVTIGSKVITGRTNANGGVNPRWDELFMFHNVEQTMDLRIEIIDKQVFKDKNIGHVVLPLHEVLQRCLTTRKQVTLDLPVYTKSRSSHGILTLSIHYAPLIPPEGLKLSARMSSDTASQPSSWPRTASTSTNSTDSGPTLPQLTQEASYPPTWGPPAQEASTLEPAAPMPWAPTPNQPPNRPNLVPAPLVIPNPPCWIPGQGSGNMPGQGSGGMPGQGSGGMSVQSSGGMPGQGSGGGMYGPGTGCGALPTPMSRQLGPTPRTRRPVRQGWVLRPPYCDRNGMQEYNPEVEWRPLGKQLPDKKWTTWQATKISNGQQVVIKKYDKSKLVAGDHDWLRRLIAIMSTLQGHPNMVLTDDPWEDEHYLYMVTEYCACGTWLNEMFARDRKPEGFLYPEREAAGILRGVYDLVATMHDQGIVHRSLTANHIMVTQEEDGSFAYKITDFKTATYISDDEQLQDASGCQLLWAAPEQLLGQYGKQADMWSCGVMLYVAICGELPFFGTSVTEVYEAQKYPVDLDFPPWSEASEDARDCVRWMLQPDPKKRAVASEIRLHKWLAPDSGAVKQPWEHLYTAP